MKISIGQITVTPDKAANIASIGSAVETASKAGASLIVFPEFAMLFNMANLKASAENLEHHERTGGGEARISAMWFEDENLNRRSHFRMGEPLTVVFNVNFLMEVLNPTLGFNIITDTGVLVSDCRSSYHEINIGMVKGPLECRIRIESVLLFPRVYIVEPWVTDTAVLRVFDWVKNAATIAVTSGSAFRGNINASHGITLIPTTWSIGKV